MANQVPRVDRAGLTRWAATSAVLSAGLVMVAGVVWKLGDALDSRVVLELVLGAAPPAFLGGLLAATWAGRAQRAPVEPGEPASRALILHLSALSGVVCTFVAGGVMLAALVVGALLWGLGGGLR